MTKHRFKFKKKRKRFIRGWRVEGLYKRRAVIFKVHKKQIQEVS